MNATDLSDEAQPHKVIEINKHLLTSKTSIILF